MDTKVVQGLVLLYTIREYIIYYLDDRVMKATEVTMENQHIHMQAFTVKEREKKKRRVMGKWTVPHNKSNRVLYIEVQPYNISTQSNMSKVS